MAGGDFFTGRPGNGPSVFIFCTHPVGADHANAERAVSRLRNACTKKAPFGELAGKVKNAPDIVHP